EGVDDRDQAERLRGGELAVDRGSVPPLPEGEYYDFQIVGLRVVTTDGRDLGEVLEVLRVGGGSDLYVTDEISVPAVDRFVREISLERGEIVVEGLDELMD
ncbi:MAG TPA: ribosome maturation factor RimM, partial [Armatimonadota bacterium]|nr:ribosome maturation factor RimM [Armatimonadota bacterium]